MPDSLKEYLAIAALLISVGSHVYFFLTKSSRGNEKDIGKMNAKITDFETRLLKLEGEFQHLPTKEGQHRLELSMSDLTGDMKQMAEALNSIKGTNVRMEKYLLERSGK
ncbi:MAG: hypothetical protein COB78_05775 [Hyphomicrobiales bacterium]|nr:MAG: hypothetical protein COB78_05775 [Hyphomicrobiales bacterium]